MKTLRTPATNGRVDQPYGHQLENGKLTPVDPEPASDNPRAIAPAGTVHPEGFHACDQAISMMMIERYLE